MRMGVARCVLGTAAVENPALMQWAAQAYPGRIAVGTTRRRKVAVRGWESESAWTPLALAQRAGVRGGHGGVHPNRATGRHARGRRRCGQRQLIDSRSQGVIVSGGVASLEDVRAYKGPVARRSSSARPCMMARSR